MFGKRPDTQNAPTPATGAARADLARDAAAAADASPDALWAPATTRVRKPIEQILLEGGHITEEQLAQAKSVQAQTPGKNIPQILLTMNAASEAQVLAAVAESLGVPFEQPERSAIDADAFNLLPADYIRQRLVVPLRFEDGVLILGVTDPNNVFLLDEVKRKIKRNIRLVVTTPMDVARIVEQMTSGKSDMKLDDIVKDMADDDVQVVKEDKDEVTDLEKIGSESPVIRFVNYLIFDAIKQGASDIHIEPKEKALKIRYRIDGILFEAMNPPHAMGAALVSRLKIMSHLDTSERRPRQVGADR